MTTKTVPEPWHSFLGELDANLSYDLHFHCMGGFVVSVLYGSSRPTADIDVLVVVPAGEQFRLLTVKGGRGSPLHKRYGVYLDVVAIAQVPEDYETRMTEMFPGTFEHLRLFALDPYDLALSKLERNIQRDRDDVRYLARTFPLDLAILHERYPEGAAAISCPP